jgi:predicted amidohydrolase YtcJ
LRPYGHCQQRRTECTWIDEGVSDPPSGSFGRDGAGRLDGSAKESAAEAIFRAIPQIDPETMAASLRETIEDSIRMGLTAAVEAAVGFTSGFDNELAVWNLLRQDVSFSPIRLGFMYQLDPKEAAVRGLMPRRDPDWQGMTLKFFADGIVGARTAAVNKPFADTGANGFFMRDEDDLERVIVEAHLDGWQTATHCVGDRASARVISAFEKAERALPAQKPRHRIEHYFVPPEGGLARMRALEALIVTQPSFLARMRRSILGAFGADAGKCTRHVRCLMLGSAGLEVPMRRPVTFRRGSGWRMPSIAVRRLARRSARTSR